MDVYLGQWLARLPADEDGVWPAALACEVLETILPSLSVKILPNR